MGEDGQDRQRPASGGAGVDLENLLEERARLEELIHRKFTRVITVMFTDFKGSTALAESEGDMATRLLIKKHHDILFPIIRNNLGTLVKTMGDGTMSWFEKAQDAVRTAAAFQSSLKEFNKTRTGKIPIVVRVGLNTGSGIVEATDIFGDVVNVAARFEAIAAPREIYLSESTFHALDDREEFRCRFIKTTELKGKTGLHKVFKVYWDSEEPMEAPLLPATEHHGGACGAADSSAAPDRAPAASPGREGAPAYGRPGAGAGMPSMLRNPFMMRPTAPTKKPMGGAGVQQEREAIGAAREVRSLVVRGGDTHKLFGEGYRVLDDIVVEPGGLLVVENAQLFFAGNAGVVSSGTFRAKSSLFTAIDPVSGWRNIALDLRDGRVNPIENCTFRFGKGRTPGSMPAPADPGHHRLNDTYLYGGGLLVRGGGVNPSPSGTAPSTGARPTRGAGSSSSGRPPRSPRAPSRTARRGFPEEGSSASARPRRFAGATSSDARRARAAAGRGAGRPAPRSTGAPSRSAGPGTSTAGGCTSPNRPPRSRSADS